MAARRPTGGVGSNQYVSRGSPIEGARSRVTTPDVTLDDPEEVAWAFHPHRSVWEDAGFRSWEEAGPWVQHGFTPADAESWDPSFTADASAGWRDAGFTRDQAVRWAMSNFTVEESIEWHHVVTGPQSARRWANLGMTPIDAAQWKRCGWSEFDAKKWQARGVGLNEANNLRAAGATPDTEPMWEMSEKRPEP